MKDLNLPCFGRSIGRSSFRNSSFGEGNLVDIGGNGMARGGGGDGEVRMRISVCGQRSISGFKVRQGKSKVKK